MFKVVASVVNKRNKLVCPITSGNGGTKRNTVIGTF